MQNNFVQQKILDYGPKTFYMFRLGQKQSVLESVTTVLYIN